MLLPHKSFLIIRRLKKRMSAMRAASQGFNSSGKTPLASMELPLLCLRVWKDSKWIDRPCFSTWSKLEAIRLVKGDLCFEAVCLCTFTLFLVGSCKISTRNFKNNWINMMVKTKVLHVDVQRSLKHRVLKSLLSSPG